MIQTTEEVETMLRAGAPIALSVSGGKDSDAMVHSIIAHLMLHALTNPLHLIHADLGRAELKATPAHVEALSQLTGIPLAIVKHSKFDLLDGIRNRMKVRPDVPPWPSPKNRQCTSDWKRGPISKWLRNQYPTGPVLCAIGMRADESPARAKRPVSKLREDCCSKARTVLDWLPLHQFSTDDVWQAIGNHPYHEAYDRGNQRVSCALCILASENDLLNGALQDAELFQAYCDIEIESGYSFRPKLWLGSVAPELLRENQRAFYTLKKG